MTSWSTIGEVRTRERSDNVDFTGNMDTCIALRTLVIDGPTVYVQAGAGIVADSVPAQEYDETLNKARGLLRAIHVAQTQVSQPEEGASVSCRLVSFAEVQGVTIVDFSHRIETARGTVANLIEVREYR